MGILREFRDFAVRGNVLDMAIGIIIGASFGKIVSSLVGDVLMPPIGMLLGKMDFSNLFVSLSTESYPSLKAAQDAGAAVIKYGAFLNTVIDFVIVAFCIFLLVKGVNKLKRQEEARPSAPPAQELLLAEIRDLLKARA